MLFQKRAVLTKLDIKDFLYIKLFDRMIQILFVIQFDLYTDGPFAWKCLNFSVY